MKKSLSKDLKKKNLSAKDLNRSRGGVLAAQVDRYKRRDSLASRFITKYIPLLLDQFGIISQG